MRIVYLGSGLPFPLTSGLLRHYHLIRELSQRHDVTLLALTGPDDTAEPPAALQAITEQTLTFPKRRRPASLAGRATRAVRWKSASDPVLDRMADAATRLLQEQRYDVVFCTGAQTLPILERLRDVPVVGDICDSSWVRLRSAVTHAAWRRWPAAIAYYLQARSLERYLLRRAARVVVASDRDRSALGARALARTSVVPNGVDVDYWRRKSPQRGADTIVFTGAMHYRPNVDAAVLLIRRIFPLVRRAVPAAQLLIVGRDPAPALLAAATAVAGVTVTGFVEDVRPYLERATVFAAPIRFGAGIQNKLLEAMAMGVPVVTSAMAADGLRTEDGHRPPLTVRSRPREFAAEIVRRLGEHAHTPSPEAAARRYVETHFDWEACGRKLEDALQRAAGRPLAQAGADTVAALPRAGAAQQPRLDRGAARSRLRTELPS